MTETQFFLYTPRLNENATKNIRKALTNNEERVVLAQIFGLNPLSVKVDQIMLDLHYINYEFCKDS